MSAPKLPDGLPPLPAGAVYLGMGGERIIVPCGGTRFAGWSLSRGESEWEDGSWAGFNDERYYAAPYDSEVARLNAHVSEPAADSEAVALVRKLHDAMDSARDCLPSDGSGASDRILTAAIKEAEAFLAREGK